MFYKRESIYAGTVNGNADQVVGACPVPAGGVLIGVFGELHMIGVEGANITEISAYGFGGEMVPLLDIEDTITTDTLWDRMVVKGSVAAEDATTNTADFDWDDVDQNPQIEAGEVNMNKLLGIGMPGKEIFSPRLEFDSFAKNKGGWVAGTPDVYNPTSYKRYRSGRRLRAEMDSYALLGVSAPQFNVEATSESTMSQNKFAFLGNLRRQMDQLMVINLQQAEAGAENPYAPASKLIQDITAPAVVQPATALIITQAWTFMAKTTFVVEVEHDTFPNTIEAR